MNTVMIILIAISSLVLGIYIVTQIECHIDRRISRKNLEKNLKEFDKKQKQDRVKDI